MDRTNERKKENEKNVNERKKKTILKLGLDRKTGNQRKLFIILRLFFGYRIRFFPYLWTFYFHFPSTKEGFKALI